MSLFNKKPNVIKIGFWGPPGSGKTTYITMLQYADLDGWSIRPRGEETQDLFIRYSEILRDKMEFAPPTVVDMVRYLTFDFERPNSLLSNTNFQVLLPEASGEYYEKPDSNPDLIQEISRFQGIIWLVDPVRIDNPVQGSRSYRRMVQEWLYRLHELQGGGTLKHKMAFCLTKMDLPEYSQYFNDPTNFCLDKLGRDVEKFLGTYCDPNNIGFFATSAIGFCQGTKKSTIDPVNNSKLIAPADPINLFSPFKWIFENIS